MDNPSTSDSNDFALKYIMNQSRLETLCRQNQSNGLPRLVLVDLDTSNGKRRQKKKAQNWCTQYSTLHPLLEQVILTNLLEYVKYYQDLKVLRQVCKTWYTATLKKWRSIAIIRVGPSINSCFESLEWSPNLCRAWDIEDFLQKYQRDNNFCQLSKYPSTKYILKGLYLASVGVLEIDTENPDEKNNRTFWNQIGSLVEFIRFEDCTFPGDTSEIFETMLAHKLANLKELTLRECSTFPQRPKIVADNQLDSVETYRASMKRNWNLQTIRIFGELPMCLFLLLINSPNIEKLMIRKSLDQKRSVQYPQLVTGSFSVARFRQAIDNKPFNVKVLDLDLQSATSSSPQFWPDLNLSLEEVSVVISCRDLTNSVIRFGNRDIHDLLRPIIWSHNNSLRSLKIVRPPILDLGNNLTLFPIYMPHLINLSISGNLITNFAFLDQVPNLKSLFIDFQCFTELDEVKPFYKDAMTNFDDADNSEELERFRCQWRPHSGRGMVSREETHLMNHLEQFSANISFSDEWRLFADWMPNLKILEAPLRNEGFKNVCKYMPQLEELTLYYEQEVEEAILIGYKTYGRKTNRNPDNITALVHLKKFEQKMLCPPYYTYRCHFGNDAVFKGFLLLPNLKEIIIHAAPTMSAKAEKALRKHVPKTKVIRCLSMADHTSGICCQIKTSKMCGSPDVSKILKKYLISFG